MSRVLKKNKRNNGILPFWETKTLDQMTNQEWEMLCDRCGNCCLHKLIDDKKRIYVTEIVCRLYDIEKCICRDYNNRSNLQDKCLVLTPGKVKLFKAWLPETCAYVRIMDNKELPNWHPILTNNPNSVHESGISIKGKAISELDFHYIDWESHVISCNNC